MSNKIPIGRVIEETFGFAFGRYLTVLGIVWLPALLLVAALFLILQPFLASFVQLALLKQVMHGGHPPLLMPMGGLIWPAEIAIYFLYAWMGVGIAKEVLGRRTGSRILYLPGLDELRVLATWVVTFLIVYVAVLVIIILAIIAGVVGVVAMGGAHQDFSIKTLLPLVPLILILVLAVYVALFYLVIRLTYLIVPNIAAESRIDIFASWRLMRGNVLRAFVIGLVCALPLLAVEFAFGISVIIPIIMHLAAMPDPAQAQAMLAVVVQQWAHAFPVFGAVLVMLMPVLAGLIGAPSAFGYRAIVPPPHAAP